MEEKVWKKSGRKVEENAEENGQDDRTPKITQKQESCPLIRIGSKVSGQ
jgi:hypothetical protein